MNTIEFRAMIILLNKSNILNIIPTKHVNNRIFRKGLGNVCFYSKKCSYSFYMLKHVMYILSLPDDPAQNRMETNNSNGNIALNIHVLRNLKETPPSISFPRVIALQKILHNFLF